jgi:hypothetical protein
MAKHSTKLPTRKTENRSFARRGLVAERAISSASKISNGSASKRSFF